MKRTRLNESTAIVIGAVITGIFAVVAAIVALNQKTEITLHLPASFPTTTPKPTVVGTPVSGADQAAAGGIGFIVKANNISLVVDEVKAYRPVLPILGKEGYIYIVVIARVVNNSQYFISPNDFYLVDDFNNHYSNWSSFEDKFNLPEFPLINYGERGAGGFIYIVPDIAITNKLRLQLEPTSSSIKEFTTLLVIMFDSPLVIENIAE